MRVNLNTKNVKAAVESLQKILKKDVPKFLSGLLSNLDDPKTLLNEKSKIAAFYETLIKKTDKDSVQATHCLAQLISELYEPTMIFAFTVDQELMVRCTDEKARNDAVQVIGQNQIDQKFRKGKAYTHNPNGAVPVCYSNNQNSLFAPYYQARGQESQNAVSLVTKASRDSFIKRLGLDLSKAKKITLSKTGETATRFFLDNNLERYFFEIYDAATSGYTRNNTIYFDPQIHSFRVLDLGKLKLVFGAKGEKDVLAYVPQKTDYAPGKGNVVVLDTEQKDDNYAVACVDPDSSWSSKWAEAPHIFADSIEIARQLYGREFALNNIQTKGGVKSFRTYITLALKEITKKDDDSKVADAVATLMDTVKNPDIALQELMDQLTSFFDKISDLKKYQLLISFLTKLYPKPDAAFLLAAATKQSEMAKHEFAYDFLAGIKAISLSEEASSDKVMALP